MTKHAENDSGEREFERQAGYLLSSKAEALSGADRSRLTRSRQQALAQFDQRASQTNLSVLLPATGAVFAAVVGVAVWFAAVQTGAPDMPGATDGYLPVTQSAIPADIDVLITEDGLELLEDLDFYNWLQSVPTGPVNGTV